MCFTPVVSLATAIIEFVLAASMFLLFRKTTLRNFFAVFILLLGFYQLTEYMVCSSNNLSFWGRLGFVTYTFLPALGLQGVLRFLRIKTNEYLLYVLPVLFSLIALFSLSFILEGRCYGPIISIKNSFFQLVSGLAAVPLFLYWLYYFGFIFVACYVLYKDYTLQKNPIKKEIDLLEIAGVLLMTLPTITFIAILPVFGVAFPSILCKFAFLLALTAFVGAYLETTLPQRNP